jgi:hypothetical protein
VPPVNEATLPAFSPAADSDRKLPKPPPSAPEGLCELHVFASFELSGTPETDALAAASRVWIYRAKAPAAIPHIQGV